MTKEREKSQLPFSQHFHFFLCEQGQPPHSAGSGNSLSFQLWRISKKQSSCVQGTALKIPHRMKGTESCCYCWRLHLTTVIEDVAVKGTATYIAHSFLTGHPILFRNDNTATSETVLRIEFSNPECGTCKFQLLPFSRKKQHLISTSYQEYLLNYSW